MTIIAFILIFSLVVIAHELGHFLLAKKNNIKVNEFAVGMGPALLKFQKGETRYVLRLFPIGGACMFEGEDGLKSKNEETSEESTESDRSFAKASVWARLSSVIAGPIFNIILAFLLSLILVGFSGSDKPFINDVMDGYPAQEAGLQGGDEIIRINGERVHLYREVTLTTLLDNGKTLEIEVNRNGEKLKTTITPKFDEETGRFYIGILGGKFVKPKGLELIQFSYYEVRYWLKSTFKSLGMLVQGKVSRNDLAGPIGIAGVIGDTIEASTPYGLPAVLLNLIQIAILLSVNLGVLNLLPLPALDGGRIVFFLIEIVRGKPVSPEKEGIVHFIGFVALMILMVFVVFNDLQRLFMK